MPRDTRVRLVDVTLHHVHFLDRSAEAAAAPEEARFALHLEPVRRSPLEMSVVLELSAQGALPFELRVAFAAHFAMDASVPQAEREDAWRAGAIDRAPDLLHPLVRDLAATLTARWGDAPLLLPADPTALGFADDLPPSPDEGR